MKDTRNHSCRYVNYSLNFEIYGHFAQISIPKPIADACNLRNNSEVLVTKVTLATRYCTDLLSVLLGGRG
jgi:hypothetical protein